MGPALHGAGAAVLILPHLHPVPVHESRHTVLSVTIVESSAVDCRHSTMQC